MKTLVYVAGPYTNPDPVLNTHVAIDAWAELSEAGYVPFVPHLNLLIHLVHPRPEDFWYEYDLQFLARCDVLLRLPGESKGADVEAAFARDRGIPVFEGLAREFIESRLV